MSRNQSPKDAACAELEQDLVLLHYDELNGIERQQVEAHLKDCATCQRYLAELTNLLPKTALTDEPPPAFWNDYSRELRHKLANRGAPTTWWRTVFSQFQPWVIPAIDRKSTRLNSSHSAKSRMPSSA